MADTCAADLDVEVVYALPQTQKLVKLRLPPGSTVQQAIEASGLIEEYPQIDLTRNKVGVFSKIVSLHTPLHDCDRVEIYRPLIADPKDARRQRAKRGKGMKKTPEKR